MKKVLFIQIACAAMMLCACGGHQSGLSCIGPQPSGPQTDK